LDNAIEKELLQRLKQGTYGEMYKFSDKTIDTAAQRMEEDGEEVEWIDDDEEEDEVEYELEHDVEDQRQFVEDFNETDEDDDEDGGTGREANDIEDL
jgi:protein MAK16